MRPWMIIFCFLLCSAHSIVCSQDPGSIKWEFPTQGDVNSSPAIGMDGTIYVGSSDDRLYAIHSDGTLKWEYLTGGSVISSPAIGSDGTIYVGSSDNNIYAIWPDGTKRWEYLTGGDVNSSPALGYDSVIYVGSDDDKLYAINPDGSLNWTFETEDDVVCSPVIGVDGTIYVGSEDHKLYAINPDGSKKWELLTEGDVESSPAIGEDGTIYIVGDDYIGDLTWMGKLYAVHPDGIKKWEFSTKRSISHSPVIGYDGTIYMGAADSVFYAVNPDGSMKWEHQLGYGIFCTAAIGVDGTLYVTTGDRMFHAIHPDGTLKWDIEFGESLRSSPAIAKDGTLYIGSKGNKLYAIHTDCGGLASSPWPKFRQNLNNDGTSVGFNIMTSSFDAVLINPDSSFYDLIIEVVHNMDEEVIIENLQLDEIYDAEQIPELPFALAPRSRDTLIVRIRADSMGLFEYEFDLSYSYGGSSHEIARKVPVGIFSYDPCETALVAQKAIDGFYQAKYNNAEISYTNNLGVIYHLLGENLLAEECFQTAIEKSLMKKYGFTGIKMNMGVVRSDLGQSQEAMDLYEAAYQDFFMHPSQETVLKPQISYNQAWELYNSGIFADAKANIGQVFNSGFSNNFLKAKAYVLLGACEYALGDFAEALLNFQNAIDIDPGSCIADMARENMVVGDVEIQSSFSAIRIYPNPNNGLFHIKFDQYAFPGISALMMYNSSGQMVMQKSIKWDHNTGDLPVNVPELSPGIYHLLLVSEEGRVHKKVIIGK